MKLTGPDILEEIQDLMTNGNWSDAQDLFKAINITGQEFEDVMDDKSDSELADFALLGFYCRDFTPDHNREY